MHALAESSGSQLSRGPLAFGAPVLACLTGVFVTGLVIEDEAGSGLGERLRSPVLEESAIR